MPFALSATSLINTPTSIQSKFTNLYISAKGNKVDYRFDPNEIIVGKQATLSITAAPDPINGHDGSRIHIHSYCSSETDIRRVRVERFKEKGKPNSVLVAASYDEQKNPYQGHVEELVIGFYLDDRQLVFVGIIVELIRSNGDIEHYLCDPQVGNGPPGTSKLYAATPLFLSA